MEYSLGISNFLEEIASLSHSIVFLYFIALITEEGFLISPCYSLELCIQMGISFLFSFAFHFSSFTAICKASSDSHFVFCIFFSRMVLIPVSWTMSRTSVHVNNILNLASWPTKPEILALCPFIKKKKTCEPLIYLNCQSQTWKPTREKGKLNICYIPDCHLQAFCVFILTTDLRGNLYAHFIDEDAEEYEKLIQNMQWKLNSDSGVYPPSMYSFF